MASCYTGFVCSATAIHTNTALPRNGALGYCVGMLRIEELRKKAGPGGRELSQAALGDLCEPKAAQQEIAREEKKTNPEHVKLGWLMRIAAALDRHWIELVELDTDAPAARDDIEREILFAVRRLRAKPDAFGMLLKSLGLDEEALGDRNKGAPPGRPTSNSAPAHVEQGGHVSRRQLRGAGD